MDLYYRRCNIKKTFNSTVKPTMIRCFLFSSNIKYFFDIFFPIIRTKPGLKECLKNLISITHFRIIFDAFSILISSLNKALIIKMSQHVLFPDPLSFLRPSFI